MKEHNKQAKSSLRFVDRKSVGTSLRILLELIKDQAGDLHYFLSEWLKNEELNGPLKSFFDKDNHMHKILRHLPEAFEEGPLTEISCESFESFISKLIKINTNNQDVYTIFRLLEKSHEDSPKLFVRGDYGSNINDYKKLWLLEYDWKTVTIEYESCQTDLLINKIEKYNHLEGLEWVKNLDPSNNTISITLNDSPILKELKERKKNK